MYTSHKGSFRHREACVDFIFLCQQVFTFGKQGGEIGSLIVNVCIPDDKVLFLWIIAHGCV